MIIGQILVNGTAFSCHRFPEPRNTLASVQHQLEEMALEEDLYALGRVDIVVQGQRGLDRLMAAIWGRGAQQAAKRRDPGPTYFPIVPASEPQCD